MAIQQGNETPPVDDYTLDFSYGQDAYNNPDRIDERAFSKGVNIKTDKGIVSSRPCFEELDLTYKDETFTVRGNIPKSTRIIFEDGRFQSFIPYFIDPEYYFIVVIAGLIYVFNTRTRTINLLSSTITVNQYSSRINWSLAGRYVVLFDYPNYPVILDGLNVFRANPLNMVNGQIQPQVPISTIGAYNQNRLAVANAGSEFILGDPTGNLLTPEAPITFWEVLGPGATYPGQSFSLGTNLTRQPITAMGFLQSIDQNTGLGPLFVATEDSIYYYRTDTPRTDWTSEVFGSLLLFNAGIVGPRAFVNVNSDIIFLSNEGHVRALSTSRNDTKTWGNVPISREVENWLKYWDKDLAQFAFMQYFNNRVYISANPYRVQVSTRDGDPITDYTNGGMVMMNFRSTATLHMEGTPVWDGLWTGAGRPMDMATSNGTAYVISKNREGKNSIWKVRPELSYDIVKGKERLIPCIMETREYFKDSRFTNKYEQSITMPVQNVAGDLTLEIERRPSQTNIFKLWKRWTYKAPFSQCFGVKSPLGLAYHRFRDLVFGAPGQPECTEDGDSIYNVFRKLQLRIRIKARYWQIEEIKIRGIASPNDDLDNTCEQETVTAIPVQCDNYWDIEEIDLCSRQ